MYLCVCNALTDRDVRRVIDEGAATSAEDVYAALRCAPQCGVCYELVQDMLDSVGAGRRSRHPAIAD